jgi:hypothetical protein
MHVIARRWIVLALALVLITTFFSFWGWPIQDAKDSAAGGANPKHSVGTIAYSR